MSKTEKQKMLAGELYRPDAEIAAEQAVTKAWLVRYNSALAQPPSERHALLCERLAHVGADAVIRPPFHCDFGYNIHVGDGVFMNFNCVILDVVAVNIGERTQIGPAVQIYAADHPRDAATRRSGLEFGREHYRPSVMRLHVAAFNERAIKVYERAGFREVGRHVRTFERWGEVEFMTMDEHS